MLVSSARALKVAALAFSAAALLGSCSTNESCPRALTGATRLILVTTGSMDRTIAELSTYVRASPAAPWRLAGAPEAAVVGAKGLAWGLTFQGLARSGEALKVEGDKRTPAGVFALGPTFGFEEATAPGHLKLEADAHLCVDDPASPHYSRIVSRAVAGEGTRGEAMWSIPVYRRGIVVDYPTNREARAGSCIFIHVWESADKGTSGCVAAPEATVARLQELAGPDTALAIVPQTARGRFRGCLP